MRLLILSRYDRLGASSRLRMLQYRPFLEDRGIVVDEAPFFPPDYLHRIYTGQSKGAATLRAMRARVAALREAGTMDVIWVEKELLPFTPWIVEKSLLHHNVPMVTDYDDAVFHRYDMHANSLVRGVLGRKIASVMEASRIVLAGNPYLADHAQSSGARRVEIVPTVVDTGNYALAPGPRQDRRPCIGWIGSPTTWAEFGKALTAQVRDVLKPADGLFRVVGGGSAAMGIAGIEALDWSEDTEADLIRGMDIGIMPLTDTPWARGKCGYKLIQYMACGLPVVASPVGVNVDIVEHGKNGFLASTDAEWREALHTLLQDPDLRRRMGAAGRVRVEQDYSLQVWGPRVADLLRSAVE